MAESFITHDLVQHITSDKQHWGVTYHQLRAVKSEQLLCLHSAPERAFRRRALMQVVGSGLKSQACVLTFIASLLPSLDTVNHGPLCLPTSIYLFYRGKVWETQKPCDFAETTQSYGIWRALLLTFWLLGQSSFLHEVSAFCFLAQIQGAMPSMEANIWCQEYIMCGFTGMTRVETPR